MTTQYVIYNNVPVGSTLSFETDFTFQGLDSALTIAANPPGTRIYKYVTFFNTDLPTTALTHTLNIPITGRTGTGGIGDLSSVSQSYIQQNPIIPILTYPEEYGSVELRFPTMQLNISGNTRPGSQSGILSISGSLTSTFGLSEFISTFINEGWSYVNNLTLQRDISNLSVIETRLVTLELFMNRILDDTNEEYSNDTRLSLRSNAQILRGTIRGLREDLGL